MNILCHLYFVDSVCTKYLKKKSDFQKLKWRNAKNSFFPLMIRCTFISNPENKIEYLFSMYLSKHFTNPSKSFTYNNRIFYPEHKILSIFVAKYSAIKYLTIS